MRSMQNGMNGFYVIEKIKLIYFQTASHAQIPFPAGKPSCQMRFDDFGVLFNQ